MYDSTRRPRVGDSVIFFPGEADQKAANNGAAFVPAVITQVFAVSSRLANLKVFPDDNGVLWRTSMSHADDAPIGTSMLNKNTICWVFKEEFDEAVADSDASLDVIYHELMVYFGKAEKKAELLPSEALFGFMGWLTTREEPLTVGASENAAPVAHLIAEFCEKQGLRDPRPGWQEKMIPMQVHLDGKSE